MGDPRQLAEAEPEIRLRMLGSSIAGLSAAEAAERLAHFGPNEPVRPITSNPLRAFATQFTHTLALLLWFAAGLAFAARIPELGGAILAVVIINGFFAFIQEYRAGQVVANLMRRVAAEALVTRDGGALTLPATNVVPGDVIHVSAGDIVPADCILIEADGLAVDLSMLTGESISVERTEEPVLAPPGTLHPGDVPSLVPAGAGVATGSGTALVWATGPSSSIGLIAASMEGIEQDKSILEKQVADLSRLTAVIAVLAGSAALCLAAVLTETSFLSALTFGTGVLVALVPEGLLPTLSVSLAIGAQRMAKRGAAVRRLSAVEVIGSVTVICTDKTGTLTENVLIVESILGPDGSTSPAPDALLTGALCNDVQNENTVPTGDSLDVALIRWVEQAGLDPRAARDSYPRQAEVAFDAHRRYMAVTCSVDGRLRRFVKGAPEAVLALTDEAVLPASIVEGIEQATSRGNRVLLLATGDEGGPLRLAGLVSFHDPPRRGVPAAIAACRAAGVRVVMLTGDHPETARAVARAVSLGGDGLPVALGSDTDTMSDVELRQFLSRDAVIARVDPEQKLRVVRMLQAGGEIVVVTGDGVNDAPALRAADVGVAMGLRGTEVAKQAADMVLADDNFATIVAAIEEGRSIRANIRRFISYVFTSNVAEMTPFLLYIFLPIPLPLAVIQALAIDIGTDLLPALALGVESPSPGIMRAPPEPPSRPLLTRTLGMRTFLFFGATEAALGLAAFFTFYVIQGWEAGDSFVPFAAVAHDATTVTFLAIVGGQVGCLFAQRDGNFLQRLSLTANPWVFWGLAFEITLALFLVYTPGLNHLFSMAAVEPLWLLVLPAGATAFLALDQLRRLVGGKQDAH